MNRTNIIFFLISVILSSCNYLKNNSNPEKTQNIIPLKTVGTDSLRDNKKTSNKTIDTNITELALIHAGLVNIKDLDSSICVDLKYSSTDNFLQKDVYGDFKNVYLQKEVAEKLVLAQLFLKSKFPYYRLIVFDAARPRSIQQIMWDTIQVPQFEKTKYLSNPKFGSLHNYGAAVDVSILDNEGKELDMGTKYDFFGELAYPEKEEQLVREGKLKKDHIENRKLLRSVMLQAGFFNIQTEWWHFNSCNRNVAMSKYKIIE